MPGPPCTNFQNDRGPFPNAAVSTSSIIRFRSYRRSYREALTFLTEIKPHLHIVNYSESVRTEAEQIFRRYGRDHRLSFSDAVSFVVATTLEARNNSKRNPFGLEFWNLAFRNLKLFRISSRQQSFGGVCLIHSICRDFISRRKYLLSSPSKRAAAARLPCVFRKALTTSSFRAALTPSR